MKKSEYFKEQLQAFETEDIKQFTELCLDGAPDYFFTVPASSSMKYHNEADCFPQGLFFHTVSGAMILEYLLQNEKGNPLFNFNVRLRDMMRCAILCHDLFKMGDQKTYEEDEEKHTHFLHPIYAQKYILSHKDCGLISRKEICKIGQLIACHMGIWNTSKYEEEIRLPIPVLPEEHVVHLADYLASRKDIIMIQPEHYKVTIDKDSEKGER